MKILALGLALLLGACTGTTFSGAAKKAKGDPPRGGQADDDDDDDDDANTSDDDEGGSIEEEGQEEGGGPGGEKDFSDLDQGKMGGDGDDAPVLVFEDGFAGAYSFRGLAPQSRNRVWAVTSNGVVTLLQLEGATVTAKKSWSGATGGGGGARTYVTEGGVVIARTGGYLYWIDPEATPEGALDKTAASKNYWKLDGPSDSDRVCVVSYRKDKKRYLGMGYGAGAFVEVPLADTKPFAPQWGKISATGSGGAAQWGYSCAIDQARLRYYSNWVRSQPQAIDLKTMKPVAATTAPNGAFTSANLANETLGPKGANGSYALGSDPDGDLLNGIGYYTLAHEAKSKTVWGAAGGMLNVIPAGCFSKVANCAGHASYAMAALGVNVGPLSALGDGWMVGMFRGNPGQVYVMRLKDPADPAKGIDAARVAELPGDPYMYTDFTGATLYLTSSENTFAAKDFIGGGKKAKHAAFSWAPKPDTPSEWTDIQLSVRCYNEGAQSKGAYVAVAPVRPAYKQTELKVASCAGAFDYIDVQLTQQGNAETLMGVKKIQVTLYE